MRTKEEYKEIARLDVVKPDFNLLAKYYPELNQERFYRYYLYYKDKGVFIEAEKTIKSKKLEKYRSELFFFLVEYGMAYEFNMWAKDVNLANENRKALKQKLELLNFFKSIKSKSNYSQLTSKEVQKLPAIKQIKFITDKNTVKTFNSYQLCYDLISLAEQQFEKEREHALKTLSKPVNTNPRKYLKDFVYQLIPLIEFLKKETKIFSSVNKTYSFICELLESLPYDIYLESSYLKDTLKSRK